MWSKLAHEKMTWSDAKIYCEKLEEDGYDNWRLPNIDELRTLIKNSPKTETGGSCKVNTHSCLSLKCALPLDNCHSDEKRHIYSKLEDRGFFWSSSEVKYDEKLGWIITVEAVENIAWGVNFESGSIGAAGKLSSNNVRCAR